jgi:hypothetical protein
MQIPRIEPVRLRAINRHITGEQWIDYQSQKDNNTCIVNLYELNHILPTEGLDKARSFVSNLLTTIPVGGRLVCLARVADSGKELAEWLLHTGTDPEWTNLTNNEVLYLKPTSVVLLSSFEHFSYSDTSRDFDHFIDYIRTVRKSSKDINAKFEGTPKTNFTTSILDVGLIWEKANDEER